jgi:hypothetical protein
MSPSMFHFTKTETADIICHLYITSHMKYFAKVLLLIQFIYLDKKAQGIQKLTKWCYGVTIRKSRPENPAGQTTQYGFNKSTKKRREK